jgi:hypothetical protein
MGAVDGLRDGTNRDAMMNRIPLVLVAILLLCSPGHGQQLSPQDSDALLDRADKILEEAKAAYEDARTKTSAQGFVDAGFKLEEARIKYLVLQEIGTPDKQKVAVDRMRTVNQLNKLIHDGKVAITGMAVEAPKEAPADPGTPKPEAPVKEPPRENPASPAPPAIKMAPASIARLPVPEGAKLRDTEKAVKDLFKELYSKKAPADRVALAKTLLEQARKTPDDPMAVWVMLREAQETASQAADVRISVSAADEAARLFDVDGLALKNAVLSTAAKAAKTPEECVSTAEALLKLVDEYVAVDLYDAADRSASSALLQARKSGDAALASRASTRSKEVGEAKTRFQSLKRVLETLARTPDDSGANSDMGQFMAFVKGNWDMGLRFLAKGSDATLKTLAAKELTYPAQASEQAAIADGWYELSEKEKSPLRKGQLLSHALMIYDGALASSTGLVRTRIENRLADIDDARYPGVNLIKFIDPKVDAQAGIWTIENRSLIAPGDHGYWTRLQIPYVAPAEYDLTYVVSTATEPYFWIFIGLPLGDGRQVMAVIGGDEGHNAGLEMIDMKEHNNNATKYALPGGMKAATIVCAVRKAGLTITLNGKKIIEWKEYQRCSIFPTWQVPNKNAFFVGMTRGTFAIRHIVMSPVSGQGKPLR